ncbi:hypothetical protein D8S78_08635 [Natrialba swarupiae]|nr:hypothetical protein [Natrialba swarupiae]
MGPRSLLPLFNVSVTIPYLLRRYERLNRREAWDFWWRLAGAGVALFLVLILVDILIVDVLALESALVDVVLAELSFSLLTVFLVPVAVRYDIAYVTDRYEWEPETWLWVAGGAIPLLNVVVVPAYVAKRNPDAPFSVLDDENSDSTDGELTASTRAPTEPKAALER